MRDDATLGQFTLKLRYPGGDTLTSSRKSGRPNALSAADASFAMFIGDCRLCFARARQMALEKSPISGFGGILRGISSTLRTSLNFSTTFSLIIFSIPLLWSLHYL